MTNPDARLLLGSVTNYEGEPQPVFRTFDGLDLTRVSILKPKGVRELEKRIADHWNSLARWRLRELDFDDLGIDLDDCRDDLAEIPGLADECDPRDLQLADWVKAAERLEAMKPYGGYAELRKLATLLLADEIPATDAPIPSRCTFLSESLADEDCGCGLGAERCRAAEDGDFGDS
jgi:hypothetical protein